MPELRVETMLERSAAADLARNTLARIPTLFGRLVYLASLRDAHSGMYRHHGLAARFGREQSRQAFLQHHEATFQEWLRLSLAEKRDDLFQFLADLEDPKPAVIEHWMKVRPYKAYIPASARESERELFFAEFEVLVEALRCEDSDSRRA